MVRIAIVEDEEKWSDQLSFYLKQFAEQESIKIDKTIFQDGKDIIEFGTKDFDIILMDIEMPNLNGMQAAEKIREKNEKVILIFITNIAQYAIKGYSVGAMNYILKPIQYFSFSQVLKKAIRSLEQRKDQFLTLNIKNGFIKIKFGDLDWIESHGHRLSFHTKDQIYETTTYSMKELRTKLKGKGFGMCSAGYLINFEKIKKICEDQVCFEQRYFPISRGKKNEFLAEWMDYMN